jgi:FkbM family methyltransferase
VNVLLEEQHGAYWPVNQCARDLRRRESRVLQAKRTAELVTKLASRRTVCVQAGGHIGLWPRELAKTFDAVYTFEPERDNFAALARNCDAHNIYASRAALGDKRGPVALDRGAVSGLHRIRMEAEGVAAGDIPQHQIDDLQLRDCAAIVLDVEGFELPALVGAFRTLKTFRPLVVVEAIDKHARALGMPGLETIEQLMIGLGYSRSQPLIGADRVFQRAG